MQESDHTMIEDPRFDLAVVIPVYNEEACIAEVVHAWRHCLSELEVNHLIMVLDDGSTDGTQSALAVFDRDERVELTTKSNSGHGPTILLGYHKAVSLAPWVFQCDGDNEMDPAFFEQLWRARDGYDALFGTRAHRSQTAGRRLISWVSRLVVHLAYARGVQDVNTPYRLMRSSVLAPLLSAIPEATFAPNLMISGALAVARVRIANFPIPHCNRRTGTVSIVKLRLWRSAALSLAQTVVRAPALRATARELAARHESAGAPQ